jgi:hypothetical protein
MSVMTQRMMFSVSLVMDVEDGGELGETALIVEELEPFQQEAAIGSRSASHVTDLD